MPQQMFLCAYCEREYQLPFLARHCELADIKALEEGEDDAP